MGTIEDVDGIFAELVVVSRLVLEGSVVTEGSIEEANVDVGSETELEELIDDDDKGLKDCESVSTDKVELELSDIGVVVAVELESDSSRISEVDVSTEVVIVVRAEKLVLSDDIIDGTEIEAEDTRFDITFEVS